MNKKKEIPKQNKPGKARIIVDQETGIRVLTRGYKFTKEDIDKACPNDGSRENNIIRSSVGLNGSSDSLKLVRLNFKKHS